MAGNTDYQALKAKSGALRLTVLEMIAAARKGHVGGAFSCLDVLVSLYHGGVLRFDPEDPGGEERDRFILSKGHSGIALFAVLADLGVLDKEAISGYCQNGGILGGHPDRSIPGIEADTGSLGHGLGIGAGMALAAKMSGASWRVFVLVGDGECHEGAVWESLVFAARHKLDNLTLIVDRNRQCVLDFTEDCAPLDPFSARLSSFGWEVREVDGHSFGELGAAFATGGTGRPLAVVAHTVKGKGVSYMERVLKWHHSVPNPSEMETARVELAAQGAPC